MKQYTPAIVNEIKKKSIFSLSRKYETRYYEGVHKEQPLRMLWIEMNAMGKPLCYPCAFWEGEQVQAFRGGLKKENQQMLQRWVQLIGPERKEEFEIHQMEESPFSALYSQAKEEADKRDGLIEPGEEEWTDEELLADDSLDDPDEPEDQQQP